MRKKYPYCEIRIEDLGGNIHIVKSVLGIRGKYQYCEIDIEDPGEISVL